MADNDANPPRRVFFQTRNGAVEHAHRLCRAKGSRLSSGVPYAPGFYRAAEGGQAYEVRLDAVDWIVIEADPLELARVVERNMRLGVQQLNREAELEDAKAEKTTDETFVRLHRREAARHRDQARDIELRLTLAVARPE